MSKPTPGPWYVETYSDGLVQIHGNERSTRREDVALYTVVVEAMGANAADAALIAAAPQMYELLRAVLDTAREDPNPRAFDKALDDIDALLAALGGKA